MKTIDDIPKLLPDVFFISIHGLGNGGGEKVADKILNSYFIYLGILPKLVPVNYYNFSDFLRFKTDNRINFLFCAGPRDILKIILCILFSSKFAVYLQVPYWKSVTFSDPIHLMIVRFFYWIIKKYASLIIVNSSNSSPYIDSLIEIVIPILRMEIYKKPSFKTLKIFTNINFVCRLANERGSGSKDIDSMLKLGREVKQYNKTLIEQKITIKHFGDINEKIKALFNDEDLPIVFFGNKKNWLELSSGPVVFLSKYEGFGLAAFEASIAGRLVFVNEAFPDELRFLCPKLKVLKTKSNASSILSQIINK